MLGAQHCSLVGQSHAGIPPDGAEHSSAAGAMHEPALTQAEPPPPMWQQTSLAPQSVA